ncbi:Uncharacterised protein [Mycobacterium tuberculosis]|nr:Uncharacterised protein [Mycobacterium tuberculosis]
MTTLEILRSGPLPSSKTSAVPDWPISVSVDPVPPTAAPTRWPTG